METRAFQVTFDAHDPAALSRFWAAALVYEIDRAAEGLRGDERMSALEAECARRIELGATRFRRFEPDWNSAGFIVMQDPEGNEFCLD